MVSIPDVDGDLSLGVLSLPATAISPIPFMDRWSNLPPTGGMDGTLFASFVPMFQGPNPLIWGFWDQIWGSWGRFRGYALKHLQYFKSTLQFHIPAIAFYFSFGGFHLISCMLLLVRDNYMLSPLQRSGISLEWCLHHLIFFVTAWFWAFACVCVCLRTGFVAFRMGLVLPDLQVGLLFANFEALMGFCIALCGGISQFFCSPVVSIFSAAIDSRFRVIRFFKGVTFGPLWVDSGFWAEPHIL